MTLVTTEVTWLQWLLEVTISIARDPLKHELTKHIGVDAYYT
jgi:hypothetical protein